MKEASGASRSLSDGHKRLSSLEIGTILLFICGFFLSLSVINFIMGLLRNGNTIWSFLGVLLLSIGFIAIVWGMRKIQTRGYIFDPPVVFSTVDKKSIDLRSNPRKLIFNKGNNRLYIATKNSIIVFDDTMNDMIDEIPIKHPGYIAVEHFKDRLFVTLERGIAVIDTSSNTLIKNIFEEFRFGQLCINFNTSMLYAINLDFNCVDVIDCSSFALISRIDSHWKPSGIAVNPNNNRIYVGFEKHPSVFVFDGSKDNLCVSKIHLPKIDHSDLESNNIYFDPSNDLLFVLQNRYYPGSGGPGGWGDFLLKIDTNVQLPNYYIHDFKCNILSRTERYLPRLRSKSVLKADDILRGSGGDSIILNSKTGLLYLINTEKKKLDEIDAHNKILRTFAINHNYVSMSMSPDGNKLYLANSGYFSNSLDIIYLQKEPTVSPPLSIENSNH